MDDFYAARSGAIPPLPWPSFASPFSLSGFEVIAAGDLEAPAATALMAFAECHASELMTVVETRRGELGELVILDFRTGRPQKSFYPIKRAERLAIRFAPQDGMPLVYVLRDDFPDTFHQQLTAEGAPRAICIDDRVWAEARLTWTPAELGHRILSWFARAIRGELHDARQPLDPLMIGSPLSFVISRRFLGGAVHTDLVAVRKTDQILRVRVCCQTNANQSQLSQQRSASGRAELTPLGEGGGAV